MKDNAKLNTNDECVNENVTDKNNTNGECINGNVISKNNTNDNCTNENTVYTNVDSNTCNNVNNPETNITKENIGNSTKNIREYNKDNIFYKIINKEINSNLVLEGKHFIAINDIRPKAPVHVLVIPKGNYVDYFDFITNASDEEIVDFNKGIAKIIEQMKLLPGGYKLLSNSGLFGQQEVPHMHVHILGKSSS